MPNMGEVSWFLLGGGEMLYFIVSYSFFWLRGVFERVLFLTLKWAKVSTKSLQPHRKIKKCGCSS